MLFLTLTFVYFERNWVFPHLACEITEHEQNYLTLLDEFEYVRMYGKFRVTF